MAADLLLSGKKFFLSPVCLVPNGRAHLGHIGGPLLRMDVLRRHLLRADAIALAINTSDTHESHVWVQAFRERTSPEAVARRYHREISADLKALHIEWDDFIDPLDTAWNDRYATVVTDFLERIVASSNTRTRMSEVPVLIAEEEEDATGVRPQVGDPVVSGWLRGTCPGCGDGLVGFFCEKCGGCFEPVEMVEPQTAHFTGAISLKPRPSLYLDFATIAEGLLDGLRERGVSPEFRQIAVGHIRRAGSNIRLTVPGRWGIPWTQPGLDSNEVIWSYSALLIGCHLTAGERFAEIVGGRNPFALDSDVTCAISFGIDNSIPYLVGAQGCLMAQDHYKPVDAFLTNHFALLDGEKFSTSRRHVIWGGDLVNRAGAHPDLARLLLCLCNPEFGRVNFDTCAFAADYDVLAQLLSRGVGLTTDFAAKAQDETLRLDVSVLRRLEAELIAQATHLCLDSFNLKAAAETVERWLQLSISLQQDASSAVTWLYGFAVLAAPFMPNLARLAWNDVGQSDLLTLHGLWSRDVRFASSRAKDELETLGTVDFMDYSSWESGANHELSQEVTT